MKWLEKIWVIKGKGLFKARAKTWYGEDEDGRVQLPWRGRSAKLSGAQVKADEEIGHGAFRSKEIDNSKAKAAELITFFDATPQGLQQAMAAEPDAPWHELKFLSTRTPENYALAKEVRKLREQYYKDNPPDQGASLDKPKSKPKAKKSLP